MTKSDKARNYLRNARGIKRINQCLIEAFNAELDRTEQISRLLDVDLAKSSSFKGFANTIHSLLERNKSRLNEVATRIDQMDNEKYRKLLKLQYIDGLKLDDTAEVMFYSVQHVHRLQTQALADFADQLGLEDD